MKTLLTDLRRKYNTQHLPSGPGGGQFAPGEGGGAATAPPPPAGTPAAVQEELKKHLALPEGVTIHPESRAANLMGTGSERFRLKIEHDPERSSWMGEAYLIHMEPKRTATVAESAHGGLFDTELAAKVPNPDVAMREFHPEVILPKEENGWTTKLEAQQQEGKLWRGMSYEEMASIKANGVVASSGEGNVGGTLQEGTTSWSSAPQEAHHYAAGFAYQHRIPSFNRPSYLLGIDKPTDASRYANTTGFGSSTEVSVKGSVPASAITDVYEIRPYEMSSHGSMGIIPATQGEHTHTDGSGDPITGSYVTRRIHLSDAAPRIEAKTVSISDLRRKFNPYHIPAGSPQGGEFTTSGAAGGGGQTGERADLVSTHRIIRDAVRLHVPQEHQAGLLGEIKDTNSFDSIDSAAWSHYAPLDDNLYTIVDVGKIDGIMEHVPDGSILTRENAADFVAGWKADAARPESVAIAEAVREKFDLPMTESHQRYLAGAKKWVDEFPVTGMLTGQQLGSFDDMVEKARVFADAQYTYTQDALKKLGIDNISVFRGVKYPEIPEELQGKDIPLAPFTGMVPGQKWLTVEGDFRPATSWSESSVKAWQFASNIGFVQPNQYVLKMDIPAKDIFSTGVTGIGQLTESEVVSLGGTKRVGIARVPTSLEQMHTNESDTA